MNRLVHALDALGVRPGDAVALLLRNGREFVETLFACQKAGVVAAPLNTWGKPAELRVSLDNVRPRVLVYDTQHAGQVPDTLPEDVVTVAAGDPASAIGGSRPYEELLGEQPETPPRPIALRRGSHRIVIHTSGTTGRPKGAARGAGGGDLAPLLGLLTVVPFTRDDVVLCPAPLFHSFGMLTFTLAALLGATLVLPEGFDPEGTLVKIEETGATALSLVPVMVRRCVSLPEEVRARRDLSSLRILMVSGSALSDDLRARARDLFGDVIYDLYGSTEAGWVAIATPEDMRERAGAVGRPVPGVEVAVFSAGGDRLPTGEVGELFIGSAARFEGYTSGEGKAERDGYLAIGDLGRLDDEGYLFVEGRADDMVVVGGENVYPAEIEAAIERLPGVQEVAVVGVPDEEYGQVLAAFVVGSAEPAQIEAACRKELASFKVPRRIERIEELPRTSTGKVRKAELGSKGGDR